MPETRKEPFFTRNRSFYRALFTMLITLALQNLIAYSVNMADNIMLGSYSQPALSGAAAVNQIFFIVQQLALGIGDGLVILAAQYWGEGRVSPIRRLTGTAMKFGVLCSVIIIALCMLMPARLLGIFTRDAAIIAEGTSYLSIIQFTFLFFIMTQVLMAALRSVEVVKISFYISIVSLVVNVGINYTLIFGRFGMPELGVRGAAIGTLAARVLEFVIILIYVLRIDKRLKLFSERFLKRDAALTKDYFRTEVPILLSSLLWAISVPMQTAILGHLSSDAIAANSVATTFYQYLKVIVQAMSAASAVMIGRAIGIGKMERIRSDARTLAVIDVIIGLILGLLLFVLRGPLLSLYRIDDSALQLADRLIVIMSVVMVGMSYQMPVSFGIIRGGGDARFTMIMNMISTWAIVMPLSFLAAFVWKWPVPFVVMAIQSDQIFKGLPTFIRFRSYKWIRKLTR
ncbi:MAG: MATE family efflux transporter [Lachnospiraceae bacterium]|nr:MATE family efflux transporter [Lachnospiraceae bacterium]